MYMYFICMYQYKSVFHQIYMFVFLFRIIDTITLLGQNNTQSMCSNNEELTVLKMIKIYTFKI